MKSKKTNKTETVIEKIPKRLPVLPLRDNVVFPYMIFPVLVGREQSIKAANYSIENSKYIFLSAQKKSSVEEPSKDDIYQEGTIAKIIQILKLPNGLLKILVDGVLQGRIIKFVSNPDFFEAEIDVITSQDTNKKETSVLLRQLGTKFKEYVNLNKNIASETINSYENIEEPDRIIYFVAANLNLSIELKQSILQKITLKDQLFEILKILNSELDLIKIEKEIENKVHENISKAQRKYLIQEQIRILNEELGEENEAMSDFEKLKAKIKSAKMPKDVTEKAMEELNKLKKMPSSSPESTVIRNYLDWLTIVPWKNKTVDNLDVENVRVILDEDHHGLDKPKDRIVEHIAVLNLVKEMRGQILCFVGPPGVGKTSLGKSIARALGRRFIRISLGGIKDEAEIRGHRRTYIGSMPGKIVQSMKRAGTINPVILLDEIDKMSADFRGDPSSAMLEVLDPEQNHSFNDHYLDVDYDLSKVMFITTANVKYNIPLPLLDRMELIELPGYLEFEKVQIAKKHIVPKQLEAHGLTKTNVLFSDEVLIKVINEYTKESGVRNLEREIASICRKTAKDIVIKTKKEKQKPENIEITTKIIENYLGVPKYRSLKKQENSYVGIVTGLAWTSVGGEILHVEATMMNGAEKLVLTGHLGEVMKESAIAALSYLRSNTTLLKLNVNFHKGKEFHIHLPEGAIPKDGPSAGVTMAMALYSIISNKPARTDIAMTGEITLRGKILAIGGLNEKLLAAQRSGIKTVLIPKENEKDLIEIAKEIKDGLEIICISTIVEAISYVFPIVKSKNIKTKK